MGIGVSLILIAVGLVLWFAVTATVAGLSIATVGIILTAVGALGLLISLLAFTAHRRSGVYEDEVL